MPEAFRLHRDMGCTRRACRLAAWRYPSGSFRGRRDMVTIITHGGRVQISMEEKPPRRVGLIALPVLGVRFCFRGLDDLTRDDFLAYFDLYTRQGGG